HNPAVWCEGFGLQPGRARSPLIVSRGRKRRHVHLKRCSQNGRRAELNTTLTAKRNLLTTPDQFRALRATMLAYRAALNHASTHAFTHGSPGQELAAPW